MGVGLRIGSLLFCVGPSLMLCDIAIGRGGTFVQRVHDIPTLPSISIIKCLADGGKRIRVKRLDYGGMLRPNLNHESQRRFLGGCEQNIPDPPTFLSFQTPNHRPEIN